VQHEILNSTFCQEQGGGFQHRCPGGRLGGKVRGRRQPKGGRRRLRGAQRGGATGRRCQDAGEEAGGACPQQRERAGEEEAESCQALTARPGVLDSGMLKPPWSSGQMLNLWNLGLTRIDNWNKSVSCTM